MSSTPALDSLWDKHRGSRCFVLGTGPSMAQVDVERLSNELTVGVNRIWHLFIPDYWISLEPREVLAAAQTSQMCGCTKLISPRQCAVVGPTYMLDFVEYQHNPDCPLGLGLPAISGRRTSSAVAISLAVFLGARELILLGMDCSFTAAGRHFYPGPVDLKNGGVRKLPSGGYTSVDLEDTKAYLEEQITELTSRGIEVRDATPGGRLEVDRVDFDELF